MKILVKNYTFNPATRQITITNLISLDLEQILLITNTTDNIIIYNFAEPTLGATVSNNIITLMYNTTSMSSGDSLQIFLDIPNETNERALAETMMTGFNAVVSELQSMKTNQGLPTAAGRLRTQNDGGGYLDTIYNIISFGGYNAPVMNMSQTNMGSIMLRQNIKIYGGSI